MDKSERMWTFLSRFINVWTFVHIIVGILSGSGALITFSKNLPLYYPIIFGVLSLGLLVLASIRIIISYKRWIATIKERRKIIEEKRDDLLSIPDTLWKLSVEQLNITKALIETGVSDGVIKEIKESLRIRYKLPTNMLPRTIAEDMETTFRVMKKLDIKTSKPENIVRAGLIIGWILDDRKVGIGVSTKTTENIPYLKTKKLLESKLAKVSSQALKDAVIMFLNIISSGDSAFIGKSYFIGDKIPDELKSYDTSLSEYGHIREMDIQSCLTEIKKLAEIECGIE